MTELSWVTMLRSGTALVVLLTFWESWPDHQVLYQTDWWPEAPVSCVDGIGLFALYSLLGLALLLGALPRLSAAALLVLHVQVYLDHAWLTYGFDDMAVMALFYGAVTPNEPQSGWWRLMVQLSLCIVYFFAGLAKALGPTWWTGEAIWKASTLPGFEGPLSPLVHQLSAWTALWMLAGWLVICIKTFYPLCIWIPRLRFTWFCLITGIHIATALVMGLYSFAAIMLVFNTAAFFSRIPIPHPYTITGRFRQRARPSHFPEGPPNPAPPDV